MSEAEIQAELMKRHSGPSMGFVKLQLGVLRTPDMVAEIAMKWTKVLRTGTIRARFMGVDSCSPWKEAKIQLRKLSLYPKGINKNVMNGHISLYLEITVTGELPLGWEVNASFKLFVFDQIRDEYLTVQGSYRSIPKEILMKKS